MPSKYELVSRIASGGMAEIWLARPHGREDGVCVVKRLLPAHADNDEFIQMFVDEGRLVASLDHPNIVQMYEVGNDPGGPFIAMEYLHGEDLRTVLRAVRQRDERVPLAQAVAIVSATLAGLHHAHEAVGLDGSALEIVHRDVSPHNVFLGFDGMVKVVDFGIAKSRARAWETRHGTLKGKIPYMAPEQIKSKRLDRRTDIYAVGVLLYELVLGRRPYVVSAGGDFALMMAITRHDVKPPNTVDANIAPALEQIITTAMSYDPASRYRTAREMRDELEAFARGARLDTSAAALAAFLADVVAPRARAWRAAQGKVGSLAAYAMRVEEERAQSSQVEDELDDGAATEQVEEGLLGSPPGAARLASSSGAVASLVERDGVTRVLLRGRIDEAFEGALLGTSVHGPVVVDLHAVERMTSFGVREWLEMNAAMDASGDVDLWLARLPEPVVAQISLIRNLLGNAKVASFEVPFLCDACGHAWKRIVDTERDAVELPQPKASCPRCYARAKVDEDPAYLEFCGAHIGRMIPAKVRAAMAALEAEDEAAGDVVDKRVTATETRLHVRREVDHAFRWHRALEGIEGRLVVEFHPAAQVTAEGAKNLARELRMLPAEVTSCVIVEAPSNLAVALGQALAESRPRGRLRIASFRLHGACGVCHATRSGVVAWEEIVAARSGRRAPSVPCRRCDAPLAVEGTSELMSALFEPPPSSVTSLSALSSLVVPTASSTSLPALASARAVTGSRTGVAALPAASPRPRRAILLALAAGPVALALVLFAVRLDAARSSAASPATAALTGPAPAAPPGAAASVTDWTVQAHAATNDEALVAARSEALRQLLDRVRASLPPAARSAAVAGSADDPARVATRFDRDVGAVASPERVKVEVDPGATDVALRVHYHLAPEAFARLVAFYGDTVTVDGVSFAHAFPDRGDGLVAVEMDGRYPDIKPGARLERFDEHPAESLDALRRLASSSSASPQRQQHRASFRQAGTTLSLTLPPS
jgi:hypothetical protein